MLLSCQLSALTAVVFLLSQPAPWAAASRRRASPRHHQVYEEYKDLLKAYNRTSFPDGDIRNLLIEGHEWRRNKEQKSANDQPEITTEVVTTVIDSRRQRKKEGRKGRRRHHKTINARLPTPNSLWRKKLFAMRRQETEDLLHTESNELDQQPAKLQPSVQKSRAALRKERRRERKKHQRQKASRPIKGQKTLSLNIARLKQRCKTKPMKQEIRVKGCLSKSIMNNLCYGQCNSFYIPETRGTGNGPPSFTSCGFCRPKTVRPIYVPLRCTNRRGHIRWKRKKVLYVKRCRCMEQEIDPEHLSLRQ